jgi:murein DD-endopeptidase MepM/ murein hydrolase activator NlpD
VLTVAQAVPYLTVVDVERQTYVQDVPYEIAYQEDPEMYQGDYEVLSAGEYGKADVTANVTYVNGEETGRQVVASVTLRQPVTELQLQGTLERPNWLPTGVFRWPCSGVITSYFGYRRPSVAGASTYHTALDIASGYGTPIYASDGGTVITAGWSGGTGYTVKIDHGNGYVTLYGHNSSLLVNVGDHVYQGQQIARMGSTGISSGVHCHFSIIENGTYVDPLNYLESR